MSLTIGGEAINETNPSVDIVARSQEVAELGQTMLSAVNEHELTSRRVAQEEDQMLRRAKQIGLGDASVTLYQRMGVFENYMRPFMDAS